MTTSERGGVLMAAVLVLGLASSVFAHPPKSGDRPHSHGTASSPGPAIAKTELVKRAKAERDRLIREQKVDAAWQAAAEPSVEEKEFNGRREWVVTFRNPDAADAAKQTLYIFLTPSGRFIAANHTGR